jgi:hypothetical protein
MLCGTVTLAYYHRNGIVAMHGSATLSICQSRAMSSSAPDTRNASTEIGAMYGFGTSVSLRHRLT